MALNEALGRELERALATEQAEQRLPTLIAGVARDGALCWSGAAGTTGAPDGVPPGTATQYRVGSITKTFAAVAVMRLRDEGALTLNDPIGAHLPELAALPITVAQLLSHTAGLRAETPAPWWERTPGSDFAALARVALRPGDLLWRPGRRYHYSNVGFALLGELVARRRAAPFSMVLRDELLGPLGMRRTTTRPVAPFVTGLAVHPHAPAVLREPEHDAVAMAPAGQLWSTLEDLVAWSQVLAGRRPEVLAAETAAEMTEPQAIVDVPERAWTGAHGLGLQLWNNGGRRRFGHTGAMPGHWAMLMIDAESTDVAVGFANSTYSGFRVPFFEGMLAALAEHSPRPPDRFAVPGGLDPDALGLVGTWYWGPVAHTLSLRADNRFELVALAGGRGALFHPAGDGTYVGEDGYFRGETLRPLRRAGEVQAFDLASFIFTRHPYDPSAEIPGGLDDAGWQARPPL